MKSERISIQLKDFSLYPGDGRVIIRSTITEIDALEIIYELLYRFDMLPEVQNQIQNELYRG